MILLLGLLFVGSSSSPATPPAPAPGPGSNVRLSLEDLRALASSVGFVGDAVDVAAAVAMAESGGNTRAVGDRGTSFGLWQINTPSHPQWRGRGGELLSPELNAREAFVLSRGGLDWSPWTTYRNGAYRRYMP